MSIKKSCHNCHGMGQIERGSSGPIDCPACKGKGHVVTITNVDHTELIRLDEIDQPDETEQENE